MVIVQADIDLTTKSHDLVNVDFWYTDVYEIVLNGVDFTDYAEMSQIFDGHVNFQPRSMVYKIGKDASEA